MNRFEVGEAVQRHCRANWFIQGKDQECRELAEWLLEHSEWELGTTDTRTEELTRTVFDYAGRPFGLDLTGGADDLAQSAIDALSECGVVIRGIDGTAARALKEGVEKRAIHPQAKLRDLEGDGWLAPGTNETGEGKDKNMETSFWVKPTDVPTRVAELARETGLPVHVYTTTALNTNFARPCFAVGDAGDPAYAIEDTLHALLDTGAGAEDLYECCGLEGRDELDEDTLAYGEFADIDLGYVVPGLIASWEKVPDEVIAEAIEALPETAAEHGGAERENDREEPEEDEGMLV